MTWKTVKVQLRSLRGHEDVIPLIYTGNTGKQTAILSTSDSLMIQYFPQSHEPHFYFQLHIMVSPNSVKLNMDCQQVDEKEIKEAGNISADGYQVLGKMSKSIGSRGDSATVSKVF